MQMHKLIVNIVLLLALLSGCATSTTTTEKTLQHVDSARQTRSSQDRQMLGPENWPTTVDATVKDIIASLSEKEKETVRNKKKEDLILFHRGWGMRIRNYYGLWRGNYQLLKDACGTGCHPDDASMVIIEKVWEGLQQ
jgi:hypothetical protein